MNILEVYADRWIPEPNTGCYIWYGYATKGYGRVWVDKKMKLVGRLICEEVYGPAPTPKYDSAHATLNGCVGAMCVNPDHLRWATRSENMLDKPLEMHLKVAGIVNAGRTVESRRAATSKWQAEKSAEERSATARKGRSAMSAEERSDIIRKGWMTRKRKKP